MPPRDRRLDRVPFRRATCGCDRGPAARLLFFAGFEDRTYGTPANLPWGHDFGDGIMRHPVQLCEAATMVLFLAAFVLLLRTVIGWRPEPAFIYFFTGAYAGQRFQWEFIKPFCRPFRAAPLQGDIPPPLPTR